MADPVSWFLIERGWDVVDSSGEQVGHVAEIIGDTAADIFSGLSVTTGLLSGDKYVPAEEVAEITEGVVKLRLTRDQFDGLGEYEAPPPSEQILAPDRKN